jgi:hypothetical protein
MTIPPLLNDATLAAIRAPFLQYLAQAGQGPGWTATRLSGDGVGSPKTSAAAAAIEGWVLVPSATTPASAPGQPVTTTSPALYVTGDTAPVTGDVLALADSPAVRYRVVGPTASLLYPAYIVERL